MVLVGWRAPPIPRCLGGAGLFRPGEADDAAGPAAAAPSLTQPGDGRGFDADALAGWRVGGRRSR
eukprot:4514565-Alexandrium_andersonii.AAC.1